MKKPARLLIVLAALFFIASFSIFCTIEINPETLGEILGMVSESETTTQEAVQDPQPQQTEEGTLQETIDLEDAGHQPVGTEEVSPEEMTGNGEQWPASIPDYVPQPEGRIMTVQEDETPQAHTWHIWYHSQTDTRESYKSKLINKGWSITSEEEDGLHATYGDPYTTIIVSIDESDQPMVFAIVKVK